MILTAIDSLIPASYNPRRIDPARLAMVALSIRKLGWLLPTYATESGELLSGHQRTHVARSELGYTQAPCVFLPDMEPRLRKAINILFNRSTNDMDIDAVPKDLHDQLSRVSLDNLAAALPDRRNHFPCLEVRQEPLDEYLQTNSGRWIPYAKNVAVSLRRHGVVMPVIVDPDGIVINGIGRLQDAAEQKRETIQVIHLTREEAAFAALTLNLLSMDFAIEDKYADLLRHNSFRRARRVRSELGRGFVFQIVGNKPAHTFDHENPAHVATWKKIHGTSVVDFGAGHLHETMLLRGMGVHVSAFEPYRMALESEDIDKTASIGLARSFLADVAAGIPYSSIFISSVLNSVPFESDRRHMVKICSALCSDRTTCYAVASSDQQTGFKNITSKFLNDSESGHIKCPLQYEPGVVLGDLATMPKVQRYHTPEQFYELFKTAFAKVKTGYDTGTNVFAQARGFLGTQGLRAALEFEFDLPYPDGSRMGLVPEAIAAFERRLGVKL